MNFLTYYYIIVPNSMISNYASKPDDVTSEDLKQKDYLENIENSNKVDIIYFLYKLFLDEKNNLKLTLKKSNEYLDKNIFICFKKSHTKGVLNSFFLCLIDFLIEKRLIHKYIKEKWNLSIYKDSLVYKQSKKLILAHCSKLFKLYNYQEILLKDEVYKVSCLFLSSILVNSSTDEEINLFNMKIPKKCNDEIKNTNSASISNISSDSTENLLIFTALFENIDSIPIKVFKYQAENIKYALFSFDLYKWCFDIFGSWLITSNTNKKEKHINSKKILENIENDIIAFKEKIQDNMLENPERIYKFKNINILSKEKLEMFILAYIIKNFEYGNKQKIVTVKQVENLYDTFAGFFCSEEIRINPLL